MSLFLPFIAGTALVHLHTLFPLISLCIALAVVSPLALKGRWPSVLFLVLGVVGALVRPHPEAGPGTAELRLSGVFTEQRPSLAEGDRLRTFVVGSARDAATGEEREGLSGVEIDVPVAGVRHDRVYEIILRMKDRTRLNPGQRGPGRFYGTVSAIEETGEAPGGTGLQQRRAALNNRIGEVLSQGNAGLVASITTGETSLLTPEIRSAFGAAGLAHILSISGTHFGLFSVLLFGIFRTLLTRLPYRQLLRLTLYASPSQAAAALCMPFMLLYLGMSGGGAPALRSFIMISLFLAGLLMGRKGAWLNSLLCAGFVLVLWDPSVILGLPFQLSFLAVLCIGLAAERPEEDEQPSRGIRAYVATSLLITLAATVGTVPLVAGYFHYLSLVSPFANLVAAPLIGFVLVPLSVAAAFVFILSGHYPLAPVIDAVAGLSISAVRLLAAVPYADIRLPAFPVILGILFYLSFVPYVAFGRRKRLLLLPVVPLLVCALIVFQEGRGLSVTFLDAGQGDASVVELPDGRTMVIDTGRTGKEVASFLRYLGKRRVDVLVLSHVHPDHSGGLANLLRTFRVGEIWDSGLIEYPEGMLSGVSHRSLQRGDVIDMGGTTVTALHPYPGFYLERGNQYTEENSASLVLKIEGGGKSILLAGDLEEEAEEEMAHLTPWIRSDVLKVPHHGSRRSADPAFLAAVSPAVAVVSVGRGNTFGHPSREMLVRLEGARVCRTDRDGAVKVTLGRAGSRVKTYRDFAFEKAETWQQEKANIRRLLETW